MIIYRYCKLSEDYKKTHNPYLIEEMNYIRERYYYLF